jgi:hypothetical protein
MPKDALIGKESGIPRRRSHLGDRRREIPRRSLEKIELQDGKEMSIWRASKVKKLEDDSCNDPVARVHSTKSYRLDDGSSVKKTRSFCGQLMIPNGVIERAVIGHKTKRGRRDWACALVTSVRSPRKLAVKSASNLPGLPLLLPSPSSSSTASASLPNLHLYHQPLPPPTSFTMGYEKGTFARSGRHRNFYLTPRPLNVH